MKTAIIVVIGLATSFAPSTAETIRKNVDEEWESFKIEHGKSYGDGDEELLRKNIFTANKWTIDRHNELYEKGATTYWMKMNHFGDWTQREFDKRMNGFEPNLAGGSENRTFTKPKDSDLPTEVDWRFEGYVTEVKNQGQCRSDWAFSATGAIEGQCYRTTENLVSLSEQQLIDCCNSNSGCNGGSTLKSLQYIISNGGVDTADTYPYEAKAGRCRYIPNRSVVRITDFVLVQPGDHHLLAAIATIGPVSVSVFASERGFRFYGGGVYNEAGCPTSSNHALLAVGYGIYRGTKEPVWILKNSWGSKWGEYGYVSMSRQQNNICGISDYVSYPIFPDEPQEAPHQR